jgi:hypothetical protein
LVLLASLEAFSAVEIVLTNGDRLVGRAVEQKEGLFLLELPADRTVAVPTQLVESIRFSEEEAAIPTDTRPPRIQIVLVDGRVLTARAVRRRDDLFLVTIGVDETIPLPLDLVRRIRFVERDTGPTPEPDPPTVSNEIETPEEQAVPKKTSEARGETEEPTRADAVASRPSLPPARSRQLAVLGEQAVFPQPPVEPWRPTDAYGRSRDVSDFNPAEWFRVHDHNWRPESAWETLPDLPDIDTGHWYRPTNPWRWRPTDGW